MSAREVIERGRYKMVVGLERRQYRRGALAPLDRLKEALRSDLQGSNWSQLLTSRRAASSRFFPGTHECNRIRSLFEAKYRKEREGTLCQAHMARDQTFEFFGQRFHYDDEIDWQADPVSGRRWPSVFHADVPVHRGDVGYGDVKYVWELNRQQYLIDLAKAHFLTGNPDDLQALQRLIRSWIRGNPYATGVNWSCALEPAFRVWSWLWAYYLTAASIDETFHLEWLLGFYDHGRFLAKHLELYSSPYNHLIGEASALYTLGLCFPEFETSAAWCSQAQEVLEGRLQEQFYPDGGSVEQSTFYHHATVGFYLLAGLIARANGRDLSQDVWRAVERGLEFSMDLMQPDGTTPEIGGADDGKPIRMEHLPFWDFRAYQAVGAVVFDRPDFKATAVRFYEDALWLLGPDGLERFSTLKSTIPCRTATLHRRSGYAIDRSDWSPRADYVCFDVGEQAAGMRHDSVPNSMHGHADCLSIIVWLGGRRVLVDSGLYAYNCGGAWEAHFRETAAHNTARIDGRDQATHIGKMAWSHSYRARIEDHAADGRQSWTVGSHDGYARSLEGVTHRRVVWRRPGGYVLVYDEFVGRGEHELEVNYQFAPGTLQICGPDAVLFDGFAEISWVGSTNWTPHNRCGGSGPEDGWICSSLGVRHPAPRLTLRARTNASRTSLLTVLASRMRSSQRVSFLPDGASTLTAVSGDSHTDWIAAAGITQGAPIDTDGFLAVCRVDADGVTEQLSVGGRRLRTNVGELIRLTHSIASVPAR